MRADRPVLLAQAFDGRYAPRALQACRKAAIFHPLRSYVYRFNGLVAAFEAANIRPFQKDRDRN